MRKCIVFLLIEIFFLLLESYLFFLLEFRRLDLIYEVRYFCWLWIYILFCFLIMESLLEWFEKFWLVNIERKGINF